MLKNISIIITILVLFQVKAYSSNPNVWDLALENIEYLPVDSFPDIPQSIKSYLVQNNYKVPQPVTSVSKNHLNVIKGNFVRSNTSDWAILCSKDYHSKLLVFESDSSKNTHFVTEFDDKNGLQGCGNGKIGYSYSIEPVDKKFIVDHQKLYGDSILPNNLDHCGVNLIFLGKGSTIYFHRDNKWLKLPGSD
jgi:hypothetical protein